MNSFIHQTSCSTNDNDSVQYDYHVSESSSGPSDAEAMDQCDFPPPRGYRYPRRNAFCHHQLMRGAVLCMMDSTRIAAEDRSFPAKPSQDQTDKFVEGGTCTPRQTKRSLAEQDISCYPHCGVCGCLFITYSRGKHLKKASMKYPSLNEAQVHDFQGELNKFSSAPYRNNNP